MKRTILTLLPGFAAMVMVALFDGCGGGEPLANVDELPVIQGYLYAGETIDDIRVTTTVALDADTVTAEMLEGASVALLKDGLRYDLTLSPGDSGLYHYEGDDLAVSPGDVFSLEVEYDGRLATAETTVPEPPLGVSLSEDEVYVTQITEGSFPGDFDPGEEEETWVRWIDPEGTMHFVVLDNIEEDPDVINEGFGGSRPMHFISQPTVQDSVRVTSRSFTHFGTHRVKVYRVNQEYVDLYLGREQDTRELNEPLTNISNGLGIFTAFASDSAFIEVIAE